MEEIEETILELEKSPLQNLCGLYESMYLEHYQNAARTYKLSVLARDTLNVGTEEKKIQFTTSELQVFRCQVQQKWSPYNIDLACVMASH